MMLSIINAFDFATFAFHTRMIYDALVFSFVWEEMIWGAGEEVFDLIIATTFGHGFQAECQNGPCGYPPNDLGVLTCNAMRFKTEIIELKS